MADRQAFLDRVFPQRWPDVPISPLSSGGSPIQLSVDTARPDELRLVIELSSFLSNDPDAIAVQGEAMVEMGATARAQENLQKLQQICGVKGCPQVSQLTAAISRGPAVAAAKTSESAKKD